MPFKFNPITGKLDLVSDLTGVLTKSQADTYYAPISVTNYTLPIASASVLGGIKVGSGLSIDDSGVLSASGGGSQTPWTSDIDGDNYSLGNVNHIVIGDTLANWDTVSSMQVRGIGAGGFTTIGDTTDNGSYPASVGTTSDNGSYPDESGGNYNNTNISYSIYPYVQRTDPSNNTYRAFNSPVTINVSDYSGNNFQVQLIWYAASGADGYIVQDTTNNKWIDTASTSLTSLTDDGSGSGWTGGTYSPFPSGWTSANVYYTVWTYKIAPDSTKVYDTTPADIYIGNSNGTGTLNVITWNAVDGASGYVIMENSSTKWLDVGNVTSAVDNNIFSGWTGGGFTPPVVSPYFTNTSQPITSFFDGTPTKIGQIGGQPFVVNAVPQDIFQFNGSGICENWFTISNPTAGDTWQPNADGLGYPALNLVDMRGYGHGRLDFFTYGGGNPTQTVPTVRWEGQDIGSWNGKHAFWVTQGGSPNAPLNEVMDIFSDNVTMLYKLKNPGMPTADPADGSNTLWYDPTTRIVYMGT